MRSIEEAIRIDGNMEEYSKRFFSVVPGTDKPRKVTVLNADELDEKTFKTQYVARNKPCVIRGAVKHWPAVQKWRDKNYWIQSCGNFKVRVFTHQNFNSPRYQKIGRSEIAFHEAAARLFQNEDHVFSIAGEEISPDNRFSVILKDIAGFTFLSSSPMPRMFERMRFFMYRRAATAWHFHDCDETLMCQINGAKRIALFSPKVRQAGRITRFLQKEKHLEGYELNLPCNLETLVVDVHEGDALYIPPYWHHGVVPLDGNVGFTLAFCWASPWHIMGDFSNYFVRSLYRTVAWPLNKYTLAAPFLGLYAGLMYLRKKITGQV